MFPFLSALVQRRDRTRLTGAASPSAKYSLSTSGSGVSSKPVRVSACQFFSFSSCKYWMCSASPFRVTLFQIEFRVYSCAGTNAHTSRLPISPSLRRPPRSGSEEIRRATAVALRGRFLVVALDLRGRFLVVALDLRALAGPALAPARGICLHRRQCLFAPA